jgi:hypothetical protein
VVDSELESFKINIDLQVYAAGQGYQRDEKESYKGLSMMRHPVTGDKIAIKRDTDGHYLYFSNRDDEDNGSIIDFVMKRKRLSLGAARKELRPWIGQPPIPVPTFPALHRTSKDRTKVQAVYARMTNATDGHPYLQRERALPGALLGLDRFAGRVRMDDRGNAVFPHFDAQGLSGYEIKNTGFTGFASGGTKALWLSREEAFDNTLVFCESAIDALSYAVLFPDDRTRYASIGGKPNPVQPELIGAAVKRMPKYSKVVAAMDADADGAKLAEVVREAVQLSQREDLVFVFQEPFGFKDWNDQLRGKQPDRFPVARVSGLDVR